MINKPLKMFFNLLSGDIYYLEADEVDNVDMYQIPLIKKPKSSCKHCYGRFYIGYISSKKHYAICPKCKNTCIDWAALKDNYIEVDTIKTA